MGFCGFNQQIDLLLRKWGHLCYQNKRLAILKNALSHELVIKSKLCSDDSSKTITPG